MPTRSCVGCGQRRHTKALIHLKCSDGEVHLATTQPQARGRGAWVCANARCMGLLSERPGVLNRAFRAKVHLADDLRSQARSLEWLKVEYWLGQCHRQGLIFRNPLQQSGDGARRVPSMWISAVDVDPVLETTIRTRWPSTPGFGGTLTEASLGTTVGRGPRPFLALQEGRATRRIQHHLQRWADMG